VVERWWEDERWAVYLFPHVILIRAFLERRLTAVEFEVLFLAAFKAEGPRRPPEIFNVLERIFFDVDDFCPDEELRERAGGIDERELRARVEAAQERLAEVATERRP